MAALPTRGFRLLGSKRGTARRHNMVTLEGCELESHAKLTEAGFRL